jgi:hypothetical protein
MKATRLSDMLFSLICLPLRLNRRVSDRIMQPADAAGRCGSFVRRPSQRIAAVRSI